jgi:hypothetical protein
MNTLALPLYCTTGEAGQLVRVSTATIWRRIKSGELAASRTHPNRGGHWVLKTADVLRCFGLDEQPTAPNATEVR